MRRIRVPRFTIAAIAFGFLASMLPVGVLAAVGEVKSHQKISDTQGSFTGELSNGDLFSYAVASIGDHDGDGEGDLVVGAIQDDDGGTDRGAVWVLFLDSDGTVKSHQKISDTEGGFTGVLDNQDWFGSAVAFMGDHDGDGVGDIAVGASRDGDGGDRRGAVWILFLDSDGSVKSHQKISDTAGGFAGTLDNTDSFGTSVASLGDQDGDGVGDLAVGAIHDGDGGFAHGAVWVLFLNSNGTVKSHQKISDTAGGFTGTLADGDRFGTSVATLADHDGDGVGDLAVGAYHDDDGGDRRGAVWVLFLNSNGTVKSHQKISNTAGGFTGVLENIDSFGISVSGLGDLDCDGEGDLAVGAWLDDDGGTNHGAVWILFLNSNGTVKSHQKISDTEGNFTGTLLDQDAMGYSVASLGDHDGDGVTDIAAGAANADDGGADRGTTWVLFLEGCTFVQCPGDTVVASHSTLDSLVLDGFVITNADTLALTFNYAVTSTGPATLDDNGNAASLSGTTPQLAPGASHTPPDAVLLVPSITTYSQQIVTYAVRAVEDTLIVDTCRTVVTFEPPVPVLITSFVARPAGPAVELEWEVYADEVIQGFRIYRQAEGGDAIVVHSDGLIPPPQRAYTDHDVLRGRSYRYTLGVVLEDGSEMRSPVARVRTSSASLALYQNRPNPFNPSTRIEFDIDRAARVHLAVYDVSGRLVRMLVDRNMTPGRHGEEWDGRDAAGNAVASGLYFYRLTAGTRTLTRKAVLLK